MSHVSLTEPMIEEVAKLFLALGDPSRLRILRCLLASKEPMSQGTVAEATGLSQANASKHLALLVRVGLVQREQQGNVVYFSPVLPLVDEVCDLVCGHVAKRVEEAYRAIR